MRVQSLLLITSTALLARDAVALPSVGYSEVINYFAPQDPAAHRPAWRSVSDRIIQKIWRLPADEHVENDGKKAAIPRAKAAIPQTGDIVLRFNISTADQAVSLADAANTLFLDVWEYTDDWVDIRLAQDIVPSLLSLLPASMEHAHTSLLGERELAQAIFETYPSPRVSSPEQSSSQHLPFAPHLRSSSGGETNIFFSDYQPFSVIQPWMRLLSSLFTTHVRLISIGTSYEGRDIPALRVGVHPTNDDAPQGPRKTILVMGGLHAREWISTSTTNYIAYSLITAYGKQRSVTELLEHFDWVFIPTVNPDGYVYTWETDRLWRKNRQRTHLRFCRGLDLDRTFDFHWDGGSTHGNPCSESFAGDAAFDGHESRILADWAKNETENNNVEFVGLLDLHSYSQQILYPYSYSCDAAPPSLENLEELAWGLAKSVRLAAGHTYQAAPACEGNVAVNGKDRTVFPRFENGGGSALDWFYHELKVKYAYQIKLRDRGSYGFLLPKEDIVPTGREMLDAVMYFGKYLDVQYGLASEDALHEDEEAARTQEDPAFDLSVDSSGYATDDSISEDAQEMLELRRRRRL